MSGVPAVIGATIDDLPEFMRLFRIMHGECGMFDLDENCIVETFNRAVKNKEGVIGLIKGERGDIRAMLYLLITRYYYTQQFHLEELFNFVAPEFRKTNYADVLLKYADHCQKMLGIPLVIGVMTNSRMEAKVRKYRRHFGMPAGAFFVHGAPSEFLERTKSLDLWRVHTRGRQSKKENGTAAYLASGTIATAIMQLPLASGA